MHANSPATHALIQRVQAIRPHSRRLVLLIRIVVVVCEHETLQYEVSPEGAVPELQAKELAAGEVAHSQLLTHGSV